MGFSSKPFLIAVTSVAALSIAACGGGGGGTASDGGEPIELRFAYEGPKGTAQEIAANMFQEELEAASDGSVTLEMFPAAQLGGEPELLVNVRNGDIDFIISSTANAAALAPASGVLSLHYLFGGQDDVIAAVSDDAVNKAYKDMAAEKVDGATPLTLFTLPLRNMYADFPVRSVDDLEGVAVRVQETATEDAIFSAYGAQPVHMAFPEVYTALQTGTVDAAENALTYYGLNKHYEVAPTMSVTEHEGNAQVIWIADKTWDRLSPEQQDAVTQAAEKVRSEQPAAAFELQEELKAEYSELGVEFIEDVDKESFQEISVPMQDGIAKDLGPHAVTILEAVRAATGG